MLTSETKAIRDQRIATDLRFRSSQKRVFAKYCRCRNRDMRRPLRGPATIIPTNNHTMYALIVTRSCFNSISKSNIIAPTRRSGRKGLGRSRDAGGVRGDMSASAQEPVDPGPTSDGPTKDARPEDAAGHDAPLEDAPVDDSPPAHSPKTGRQLRPNPILSSPNVESAPPQLSWPPWQQQPRSSAGDTTSAGVRSGDQPADNWGRYAMGLIVVATAAVAGTVSYLWS